VVSQDSLLSIPGSNMSLKCVFYDHFHIGFQGDVCHYINKKMYKTARNYILMIFSNKKVKLVSNIFDKVHIIWQHGFKLAKVVQWKKK